MYTCVYVRCVAKEFGKQTKTTFGQIECIFFFCVFGNFNTPLGICCVHKAKNGRQKTEKNK